MSQQHNNFFMTYMIKNNVSIDKYRVNFRSIIHIDDEKHGVYFYLLFAYKLVKFDQLVVMFVIFNKLYRIKILNNNVFSNKYLI